MHCSRPVDARIWFSVSHATCGGKLQKINISKGAACTAQPNHSWRCSAMQSKIRLLQRSPPAHLQVGARRESLDVCNILLHEKERRELRKQVHAPNLRGKGRRRGARHRQRITNFYDVASSRRRHARHGPLAAVQLRCPRQQQFWSRQRSPTRVKRVACLWEGEQEHLQAHDITVVLDDAFLRNPVGLAKVAQRYIARGKCSVTAYARVLEYGSRAAGRTLAVERGELVDLFPPSGLLLWRRLRLRLTPRHALLPH